ncbi:CBS domain-containing protein [Desulfuribacillus stibiiarsenatis]|uniref:CBS domain-containing protein n=1 Tax=Desulfuribacillus stibiiarsenatis TaxID=1390249 RepID=A0A1E5L9P3_9FIRM|nr:CBS domain-containing protein [Desulfuribacillus stibiiarsenatis]OEH86653.1 CBS domain-containing protein [Desulfuribacillus stibiiarsenatis]
MSQTIREIMSGNLATVTTQDSVIKAAQIMSQYNIGSVPVVDNGQLVGMLTDRDIVLRSVATGGNLDQVSVRQIMTTNVVTATPDMDISQAANIMASNQIRRLPVIDNDQLIGMVALGDLALESDHIDEAGNALNDISKP